MLEDQFFSSTYMKIMQLNRSLYKVNGCNESLYKSNNIYTYSMHAWLIKKKMSKLLSFEVHN